MRAIRIDGLDELNRKFGKMGGKVDAAAARAMKITAVNLRTDVVKAINSGPASGRKRATSNSQASAPGEAPMTDTGRLAGSVYMHVKKTMATVGSNFVYAGMLEFGTRRMGARPAWRPAAERARKALPDILSKQIKRAMK